MSRHRAGTGAPVTRGMRVLLVVAAVLVFLAGLQLHRLPDPDGGVVRVDHRRADDQPVFLGAAYWSSAVSGGRGRALATWGRARLTVWTVLVFTVLTLVVTLVHLDEFHLGAEHPASARADHLGLAGDLRRGAGRDGRRPGAAGARRRHDGRGRRTPPGGPAVAPRRPRHAAHHDRCGAAAGARVGRRRLGVAADTAHRPRHRRVAGGARLGLGPRPPRRRPGVGAARGAHRAAFVVSSRSRCSATATPSTGRAGRRRRTSSGWRGSRSCPPGSWRSEQRAQRVEDATR